MTDKSIVEGLVELLRDKRRLVREDANTLCYVLQGLRSVFERYFPKESVICVETGRLYSNAFQLQKSGKDVVMGSYRCSLKEVVMDTKALIDMAVYEVKAVGLPENASSAGPVFAPQSIDSVTGVIWGLKGNLTPQQRKELVAAARSTAESAESWSYINDKLKEFGLGTLAGILSDLLSQPAVWEGVKELL